MFFLLGAVVNVPWLALGTVFLLVTERTARRVQWGLVLFSMFAAGVVLSAPIDPIHGTAIPQGNDVFGALPRVLAAVGSGVAAVVIFVGAVVSAVRFARDPQFPDHGRLAAANGLIALGTLVLSSGGLVQGLVGHDEAFALSLAVGVTSSTSGSSSPGRARKGSPWNPKILTESGRIPQALPAQRRLGARASPGGKLELIRCVGVGGVDIGLPVFAKPPSPPQARLRPRNRILLLRSASLRDTGGPARGALDRASGLVPPAQGTAG